MLGESSGVERWEEEVFEELVGVGGGEGSLEELSGIEGIIELFISIKKVKTAFGFLRKGMNLRNEGH